MAKKLYYYRVDSNGQPIMGSNFTSNKKLRQKRIREFTPQQTICCTGEDETFPASRIKYFVKLDGDKQPINNSLRRVSNVPTQGLWQQIKCGCGSETIVVGPPEFDYDITRLFEGEEPFNAEYSSEFSPESNNNEGSIIYTFGDLGQYEAFSVYIKLEGNFTLDIETDVDYVVTYEGGYTIATFDGGTSHFLSIINEGTLVVNYTRQ